MTTKSLDISNKLDFKLATPEETGRVLALRLKEQRIYRRWTQQELADRCDLDVGTIKNLELKGQTSLHSLIRIVSALNLTQELQSLFEIKTLSIADMVSLEKLRGSRARKRVRKSTKGISR